MAFDHPRPFAAMLLAGLFAASCATPTEEGRGDEQQPTLDATTGSPVATAPSTQDPQDPQGIGEERRAALVQKYLRTARDLRTRGESQAALDFLLRAKELDPANEEVRDEIAAVSAELGRVDGLSITYSQEMLRRQRIAETRLRTLVREKLQSGRTAMDEKNHTRAIQHFRQALLNMEQGEARGMDWGELRTEARELLDRAREAEAQQQEALTEAQEREFEQALREEYEARQARRRAQVDGTLAEAVRAFENKQFRKASDLALQALDLEPNNAFAEDLHNASLKAAKGDAQSRYYVRKAKEVREMLEAYEELKIPYTDILRLDAETFERARRRSANVLPEAELSPEDSATLEQVRNTPVGKLTFTAENGGYQEVVQTLHSLTEVPIIVTPQGREVIEGEGLIMEIEMASSISLANFLDLMTSRSESLVWRVEDGVVQFTSIDAAGASNIVRTYDVRDLVFPRTEFVAPMIEDIPGDEGALGTVPRTGGEGEEKVAFVESTVLEDNIRRATGRDYWDTQGELRALDTGGYLMVRASPEMHQKVWKVLSEMRRFATSVVTIDSKFLTVTRNFLQEVGVDIRGLGGTGNKGTVATLDEITNGLQNNAGRGLDNGGTGDPAANPASGLFYNDGGDGDLRARTENFVQEGLGNALSTTGGLTAGWTLLDDVQLQTILRAVEKSEESEVVNSQILTVLNNERGHVAVINQTAFVKDFEVDVAQASFIADPKVDVIQDGIVLDVRPVIAHDRKQITLTLKPTVATLNRPIPTFTTSLAGSTLPVTLQMPVLTVTNFASTVTVPDGGTVLIGGLRQILTKERRAEVPILGSLPLISFLFKNEGTADESRSLMVMVQAWITDIRELDR